MSKNSSGCFVIAEAGVNHNGSLELALRLVDEAVKAKVDAVKFQTFNAEKLVSKNAIKAEYQVQNTGSNESQYAMLKKLELSYNDFRTIKEYCDKSNIQFLSTAFDQDSVDFLFDLGMRIFKIPSGEITNYPYLVKIAKTGCPIILSTGMATLNEVREAVELLQKNGAEEITVLHCTTEYPAPYNEVNLRAMHTMSEELSLPVGYSDHTNGIEIPVAAVALGAKVIEKHFTLDRNLPGPDHVSSLDPSELGKMMIAIRNVESSLGDGEKRPTPSELKNLSVARKSIVASKPIKVGQLFTEENLSCKRPGDGISPMKWEEVLGIAATQDFDVDEKIVL